MAESDFVKAEQELSVLDDDQSEEKSDYSSVSVAPSLEHIMAEQGGLVNINEASLEDLVKVKHIGLRRAGALLKRRRMRAVDLSFLGSVFKSKNKLREIAHEITLDGIVPVSSFFQEMSPKETESFDSDTKTHLELYVEAISQDMGKLSDKVDTLAMSQDVGKLSDKVDTLSTTVDTVGWKFYMAMST